MVHGRRCGSFTAPFLLLFLIATSGGGCHAEGLGGATSSLAAAPPSAGTILLDEVGVREPADPNDVGVAWDTAPAGAFTNYYAALRGENGVDRDVELASRIAAAIAAWPAADPARFAAPPAGLIAGLTNLGADSYDILEVELDRRTGTPLHVDRLGYVRRELDPISLVEEYVAARLRLLRAALR